MQIGQLAKRDRGVALRNHAKMTIPANFEYRPPNIIIFSFTPEELWITFFGVYP
jgi:hypothetical protein